MVYTAVYRGYKIAKRLYQYGKPTVQGKSFISKFPPQYRKDVRTILKGSEIAFTGGLVADIAKDLLSDDGTGIDHGIPQRQKKRPFSNYKTRSGYRRRSNRRSGFCSCNKCRRQCSGSF